MHRQKPRQPTQIHHGRRKREDLLDFRPTSQLHLAQNAVLRGVAEHRLNELSRVLAQPVTGVARRACIDADAAARGVLRNVRRDVDAAAAFDEGLDVVDLVRTDGLTHFARQLGENLDRRFALGSTGWLEASKPL